jgi:hypothetical protein
MKKFIAWGAKLHSHTQSYVHVAYAKAFQHLGYDIYHFDDRDNVQGFDFSNSIFLTSGGHEKNIPMIKDAKYILHNCDLQRYSGLNYIILQVYTNDLEEGNERYVAEDMEKLDYLIYYSKKYNIIYQPWATDLLPHEIDTNYNHVSNKESVWVGTIAGGFHGNIPEIESFRQSCKRLGYNFTVYNPGRNSFEQNRNLVLNSEVAPAINGEWQKTKHYIPCRIFKNISYGKIGLTNNLAVKKMLDGNVVYGESNQLLENYLLLDSNERNKIFTNSCLMVKEKHTYVNRVNSILKFLK